MPVFLVMVVGYFLYKFGFTNDEFLKTANRFVFKITLPCLLLMDMMQCDIKKIFDGKYVLYLRDYYVCVKDGVLYDVCESTNDSVYSYWKLE